MLAKAQHRPPAHYDTVPVKRCGFHPPSIVRKTDSSAAPKSCSITFSNSQHRLSHSTELSPEAAVQEKPLLQSLSFIKMLHQQCLGLLLGPFLQVLGVLDVCDGEVVAPMKQPPVARTRPTTR